MGIEAGLKIFRPSPYLPDYITFAKRVFKLLMWWDWIPCIVLSEIVCNFKNNVRRLVHLRRFSDSHPSSAYNFSLDVPLHAPDTAKEAEYCTDSILSI